LLKALVIYPPKKQYDLGDLLQIARAEAKKAVRTSQLISVRAIRFFPDCGVYVALYEAPRCTKPPGVGGKGNAGR